MVNLRQTPELHLEMEIFSRAQRFPALDDGTLALCLPNDDVNDS